MRRDKKKKNGEPQRKETRFVVVDECLVGLVLVGLVLVVLLGCCCVVVRLL